MTERVLNIAISHVDGELEVQAEGSPKGKRRIILLIHGYNVIARSGRTEYDKLLMNLRDSLHVPESILANVWFVYWPGYMRSIFSAQRKSLISWTTYPWQIDRAKRAGSTLANYLRTLVEPNNEPTEVVLVAHSLGCRLVMEVLKNFAGEIGQGTPRYTEACLLAAAVPEFMVRESNEFWYAAHYPKQTMVMFSPYADRVLRLGFPFGQTVAGEGRFPQAVGRWGKPHFIWRNRIRTNLQHSEYFGDEITAQSVARLFKLAVGHVLPKLALGEWNLPVFEGMPEYATQSRGLRKRRLGEA